MQQISVSVPASADYLALAITFLEGCRGLASDGSQLLETGLATGGVANYGSIHKGESFDEVMSTGGAVLQLQTEEISNFSDYEDSPVDVDAALAFSDAVATDVQVPISAPSAPVAPAPAEPEYTIEHQMTEKAGQLERADFERQGWTLPLLIEHGYIIEVKTPKLSAAPVAPLPAAVPPSPTAPTAPQPSGNTPAPQPALTVELDKRGLPWDERIHGSTKTKNVKGEWNFKRNLDRTTVPAIEAELFALVASGQVKVSNPIAPNAKITAPGVTPGLSPVAALMRKITGCMRDNPMLNEATVTRIFQVHKIPAINQAGKPEHAAAVDIIAAGLFHPDGSLNVAWVNQVVAQHVPA